MRVLVLGGAGFLGRHVVCALAARGHHVVIGSRDARRVARVAASLNVRVEFRSVRFEQLTVSGGWDAALDGVDVAVNCVGILREWGAATYERIHHFAPAALAADCARRRVRLIHISAPGRPTGEYRSAQREGIPTKPHAAASSVRNSAASGRSR